MKKISLLGLGVLIAASTALADPPPGVKLKSTGQGDIHQDDGGAVGDPLQGKPVNKEWDAGAPLTQQPYDDNCKDDRCIRAEQRQLGNTTWEQDRQPGGLHHSPKKSGSTPSTTSTPSTPSTTSTTTTPP